MNGNSDSILSVYSDARAEYTKQLCVFLVPAYFQFFIELLERAKTETSAEPKRSLWQFQNFLNEIHDWNMEKVNNEIHRINTNSGCDYLEDLLTAVFIAHTKVLTAIRLSSNKKKIEINVPKVEHFLFKVLCETSKLLWSSTYLFRDGIPGIEKQQNYRSIEHIINEGIIQAVRNLIPVRAILKDFVNNDNNNDDDGSDDEKDEEHDTVATAAPVAHLENTNEELKQDIAIPISESSNTESTINPELDIPKINEITPIVTIDSSDIPPTTDLSTPVMKNEVIDDRQIHTTTELPPQTIIIDDKPGVRFGEFNALFDSDNPMESDMILESANDEDDDTPALEILDETGTPLAEGFDFENLDKTNDSDNLSINGYEELN